MRRLPILLLLLLAATPPRAQPATHGGPVRVLAPHPESAALLSGGFDGRVVIRAGEATRAAAAHPGGVAAAAALPGGGWASGGEDGRVLLWPADPAGPPRLLEQGAAPVAALAARDGALLVAAREGGLRLWNLAAGTARPIEGHPGPLAAAALLADGTPVTAGADGTLRAWGPDGTAAVLLRLGWPATALLALPDGGLVLGDAEGSVRLLDAAGGVRALSGGARPVTGLAASADGRVLAEATLGGAVLLWSLPEGRLGATLAGSGAPVWSVALSPDGRTAWSGDAQGRVRRWDARSGRALDPDGGEPFGDPDRSAAAGGGGPNDPAAGRSAAGAPDAPPDPAAAAPSATVFRACAACHALRQGEGPRAGPHLQGILGRRMGAVEGYPYSARLARGDLVWTPEAVADLFRRGPDVVLPGTTMPTQRLPDPGELAALLGFLGTATRPDPPPDAPR